MFYGFSGLPGAGKTLNALAFIVREDLFANRPVYYHRIPLLVLDIDVITSFSGWFYGWYLRDNSNQAIIRKLKKIHLEDRFADVDDFPYLQFEFEKANFVEIFMFWVRRLYSADRLKALDEMLEIREIKDSDLSFDDIRMLNLNFTHVDNPASWVDLPKQSVFLADEIHHYWPVRTRDKLPSELEAISTHRHDGKDLIFITQDFANTDVFLRRMMNYHYHYEFVGGDRAACFYRKKYIDISNPFDKKSADKTAPKRPTEFYGSYFSTELDTNNNKLAKGARNAIWLGSISLVLLVVALFFGFPYAYSMIMGGDEVEQTTVVTTSSSVPVSVPRFTLPDLSNYEPTIQGMPWSAPVYKDSLKVSQYPDLLCFEYDDTCKCLTQQNTQYTISDTYCKAIASGGVFNPYDKKMSENTRML